MPGFLRDGYILWALVAETDLNTHECFIVELDVKISLKIGCRCTKEFGSSSNISILYM